MSDNYFISPIGFSRSIFLIYDNGQPFASFGHKARVPGGLLMSLPTAPPLDDQPRALITEYLLLRSDGGTGSRYRTRDTGPLSKYRKRYQSDPRSIYFSGEIDDRSAKWNHAHVTFDGKTLPMIYCSARAPHYPHPLEKNHRATALLNARGQELAGQRGPYDHEALELSDSVAYGNAYVVLHQMWKPCVDIRATNYKRRMDFYRQARLLFGKGWWDAIWIGDDFRVYADNMNDLFHAKMALHK